MPLAIKHIVIADDDPDDVQLFQEAVVEICPDVNLRVANDGVELLQTIVVPPKPDVILLDLNMPRKSGIECLEEIRTKDDFLHIPIVILSTSSHPHDINYCLRKGANHYFVKPQSFEGMKEIVQTVCSGSFSSQR